MGLFDSSAYRKLAKCIADDCKLYTHNLAIYGSCDKPMIEMNTANKQKPKANPQNELYALSLGTMEWTYITPKEAADYFRPYDYVSGRKTKFYSDYGFGSISGGGKQEEKKLENLADMVISNLGGGYRSFVHYTTSSGGGSGVSDTYQIYTNHEYSGNISVSGGTGSGGRCYVVICKESEYDKLKENALSSLSKVLKAEKKIKL